MFEQANFEKLVHELKMKALEKLHVCKQLLQAISFMHHLYSVQDLDAAEEENRKLLQEYWEVLPPFAWVEQIPRLIDMERQRRARRDAMLADNGRVYV